MKILSVAGQSIGLPVRTHIQMGDDCSDCQSNYENDVENNCSGKRPFDFNTCGNRAASTLKACKEKYDCSF